MDRLLDTYPDTFIGIQLHLNDSWEVSWSARRGSFYGVSGYPDAWFDGIVERSGTYTNDPQAYDYYNSARAARAAVPTDVAMTLSVVRVAEDTFDVTATVRNESGSSMDLKAHIPQVLDYYPSTSDDHYRNCVMDCLSSVNFTVAAGDSYVFERQFQLTGDSWTNREDVKFIGFVREQATSGPAEVHNSTQLPWPFYLDGDVDRDGDVEISDLAAMLAAYGTCDGDADYVPEADFNWDQCITLADLATLLGHYGETWP